MVGTGMMNSTFVVVVGILSAFAPEQIGAFQVARQSRLEPLPSARTRLSPQAPSKSTLFVEQRGVRLRSTPTVNDEKQTTLVRRTKKFILALFRILMAPLRRLRSHTKESATMENEATRTLVVNETPLSVEAAEPTLMETATIEPSVESTEIVDKPVVDDSAAGSNKSIRAARVTSTQQGARWATASVDLSGDWSMIESEDFKQQYDEYLKRLGQPMIVRGIALGIIGLTTELTKQEDEGRTLFIRGTNARGVWERTLQSSGADATTTEYEPLEIDVVTADDEIVKAEAWWEDNGTVHVSWMRGVSKYGGGDFMSRRYLEEGGKVLVCETVFQPNDKTRETANVTWKFLRKGQKL